MKSESKPTRVIIIGGGITGLSAAWRLQRSSPFPLDIHLFEASDHWGGKVSTEELLVEGSRIEAEAGAESFVTRKPQVWELAHELGLSESIVAESNEARGTYLFHQGQMVPVPLSPGGFIQSPLMTISGKLRLLLEPLIPRKRDDEDESLAEFARRRLGHQAADNMITPILAGIYNADPERQSILTTSPIMRQMEREHGSLFLAMLARMLRPSKNRSQRPRLISFEGGTRQLVQALVRSIDGNLQLNTSADQLQTDKDGFRVISSAGERVLARAVLLATPANKAAPVVNHLAPQAAASMRQIRHSDIGTLLLALPAEVAQPKPGISGLMIPRRESKLIDAITWLGHHHVGLAGTQVAVLKLYFGGAAPHLMEHDPAGATELLLAELSGILKAPIKPLAARLNRWPKGYPQADVGHLKLVERLESQLPAGLFVAGSSYRGLAVPDCVRQADRAAQEIIQFLSRTERKHDEKNYADP